MTLLKKMIRDQLLGPNYDTVILPLFVKYEAMKSEREAMAIKLKPAYDEVVRLHNEKKLYIQNLTASTFTWLKGKRPTAKELESIALPLLHQKISNTIKIWEANYKKTIGPDGKESYTDGTYFYYTTQNISVHSGYGPLDMNKYQFIEDSTLPTSATSGINTPVAIYFGKVLDSQGNTVRNLYENTSVVYQAEIISVKPYLDALNFFGFKAEGITIYPSTLPSFESMLPSDYKGINAYPLLRAFNFFISVINHYEKYQTTGLLFTNPNDRDVQVSILSGNVLKALTSQARFLVPNGQNLVDYNSTLAGQAGISPTLGQFIWVCTMGYLKSGNIIVSTLQKYFSTNETYTQVVERMRAMGTNQTADGFFTAPPFLFNMMGSDWNATSMPTGNMVLKVIKDCLIEAEAFYKIIFPSKKQ